MCDVTKPLCDKIDQLKLHILFLQYHNNNQDGCKLVFKEIEIIKLDMILKLQELKHILKETRKLVEKQQHLEALAIQYNLKADLLNKCVDEHMHTEDLESEVSNNEPSLNLTSSASCGPSFMDMSPIVGNTKAPRSTLRPKLLNFDLQALDEREFKMLPKYMIGRLPLQAVNSFIERVNDAFNRKYEILSKPKLTLINDELKKYNKYKALQVNELKGKRFITEEDIAFEYNKSILDKKSYNFLTILRHAKRLLRITANGNAVYLKTIAD